MYLFRGNVSSLVTGSMVRWSLVISVRRGFRNLLAVGTVTSLRV